MDQLLTDGQSTIGGGKEVAYIRCSFDDPAYDRPQKRG